MSPRGSAARTGELCCAAQGGDCCPATTTCCGTDCCWPGEECCLAADECCAVGYTCCGGVECCAVDFCCGNGECCTQECEECLENGSLSGGSIDVQPNPACIGDTITFTASGVVDDGGIKRVYCTAKEAIPPVAPPYTWQLTIPPDYPPPLPPLSGTGPAVSVVAEAAGTYSATFTATADRECEPPEITVGPATATVTEIPITAEVIDQDDPTNAMWTGLAEGSPVFGGSEASTADNVRLEVVPPPGPVSNIVWTVEGPGGATYNPPPTGAEAVEWDLVPKQANNGSWFDGGAGRGRGARTVRGADCGGAVGLGLCLGHRTFLLGQGPMRAGTSLSRRQGMALNSARAWPFAA